MSQHDDRSTARRKLERAQRKKAWAARNLPCVRCGQAIDYSTPWPDPECCSDEHIQPWSTHPHLRDEPSNHGPAHLRCNQSAGNRGMAPALGSTSREW